MRHPTGEPHAREASGFAEFFRGAVRFLGFGRAPSPEKAAAARASRRSFLASLSPEQRTEAVMRQATELVGSSGPRARPLRKRDD